MDPTEAPLRLRILSVATGTGTKTLTTDRVPKGELWRVTTHSFEDKTSGFTNLRTYIDGHGYSHYLKEQQGGLKARLYWDDVEQLLGEGEALSADVTGTASADSLALLVTGIRYCFPEGA